MTIFDAEYQPIKLGDALALGALLEGRDPAIS